MPTFVPARSFTRQASLAASEPRISDPNQLRAYLTRHGERIIRQVTAEEPLELSRLENVLARENEKRGDPPLPLEEAFAVADKLYGKRLTEEAAATSAMRQALYSSEPINPRSQFEYLVETSSDDEEGWFPRGEISAFGGPSGSGKTRFGIDLILHFKSGTEWFGRPVNSLDHLIVSYDRSKRSFERTLRKMGLRPGDISFHRPTETEAKKPVPEFLAALLYRPEYSNVGVVIVEGADMKVRKGKINDLGEVASYADDLQRFAERLGIHLIVTLGTSKMRSNDKYTSLRERIIGSTSWGRKLETIVYLEQDDKDESARSVTILTRNAADEKHKFRFDNGSLTEEVFDMRPRTRLELWVTNQLKPGQAFTLQQATEALGAPKSTVESALDSLRKDGKVTKTKHGTYMRSDAGTGNDVHIPGMEALGQ